MTKPQNRPLCGREGKVKFALILTIFASLFGKVAGFEIH
jgi:hypothetical protein